MKIADLEHRLQRQPLRQLPAEWRSQILGLAKASALPAPSTLDRGPRRGWWREFLWPSPRAWVGLAAAWAVILLLNLSLPEPAPKAEVPEPSGQVLKVLKEQRRMLAELIEPD